jgi:hypothetical protein
MRTVIRSRRVLAGLLNSSRLRPSPAAVVRRSRLAWAGGSISARSAFACDHVRPPSSLVAIILKFSALGGWLRMFSISRPPASSTTWLSLVPASALPPICQLRPPSSLKMTCE